MAAGYGEEWGLAFPILVVKEGSNIRLSQVRSTNSLGAQISITVVLLNLCAAPIANVA